MPSDSDPVLYPVLVYDDPAAALRFLTEAFGFRERVVYRGPGESIQHASLSLGTGSVMLGPTSGGSLGLVSPRESGASSAAVYAFVPDVRAHYERAVAAGAEVVQDLTSTEYGSTEYAVRDPEGHLWSFGDYRADVGV